MDKNGVTGSIKEVRGAAEDAIGWAVSDGVGDKVVDSALNDAVRDAEAMKSAGLLVSGPDQMGR